MWVDRNLYDDIRKKLWETAAVNQSLEKQVAAMQTTIDWMAIRLTTVEHEKAQLLYNYTGVKIETPVFKKAQSEPPIDLNATSMFQDIGDKKAEELGVTWDGKGEILFTK